MHRARAEPVPWCRSSPPFEVRPRESYVAGYVRGDLTPPDPNRIVPEAHLRPASRACRRPPSTSRPGSPGAPDDRPPAVATDELARLFGRQRRRWRVSRCTIEAGGPSPCSDRTAPARPRSCASWPPASGRRSAAPAIDGIDRWRDRRAGPPTRRLPVARHRPLRRPDRAREPGASPPRCCCDAGARRWRWTARSTTVGLTAVAGDARRAPSRPACGSGWPLAGSARTTVAACSSTSRTPRSTRMAWRWSTGCWGAGTRPGVTRAGRVAPGERIASTGRRHGAARRAASWPRSSGSGVTSARPAPDR